MLVTSQGESLFNIFLFFKYGALIHSPGNEIGLPLGKQNINLFRLQIRQRNEPNYVGRFLLLLYCLTLQ